MKRLNVLIVLTSLIFASNVFAQSLPRGSENCRGVNWNAEPKYKPSEENLVSRFPMAKEVILCLERQLGDLNLFTSQNFTVYERSRISGNQLRSVIRMLGLQASENMRPAIRETLLAYQLSLSGPKVWHLYRLEVSGVVTPRVEITLNRLQSSIEGNPNLSVEQILEAHFQPQN